MSRLARWYLNILKLNLFSKEDEFEIDDASIDLLVEEGTQLQLQRVKEYGIILPKSKQDEYLENHNKFELKIGDKVKVLRIAETKENGWWTSWNNLAMDKYVGQILTYQQDLGGIGFRCKSQDGECYNYPYFVLEKVVEEYVPFDFTDDLLGKHVISKDKTCKGVIHYQMKYGIVIYSNVEMPYENLLDKYTFIDGTKCGKLKQ